MSNTITPQKASHLLAAFMAANTPVLLTGAPGIGKSSIVEQAAASIGYDIILSHPVVSDPTDAKGLPWPSKDGASATFLPFGDLARAINATRPTLWFLDDLGQASPAVQASYMQLLLARSVNGHKLPDCVTFAAATNRRSDRAGVSGILTPVLSRFGTVIEVEVSVDCWTQWALGAGMPPELISFIRFRPNLLHVFDPTKRSNDMENFPCPRTWAFTGKTLNMALPEDLEFTAIAGAVGEGAAFELRAFLKMYRSNMPSPDKIILDPDNAPIPDRPDMIWAVCSALARKASDSNCGRIFRYAERLHGDGKSEFATLMVKDTTRLHPEVHDTPDWTRLAVSEFGQTFLG
ncbi:ATP-binding protein [Simplicispira suum]|uniref:ATPase n=1 Tax=Simplicispira suum TaxID=2109915 RepID=A0A2S0N6C0_9BURK|nr:ATP-binding protein [Simplicispira suum]AVO43511.1 ATPase [Simplicispira suum]